MKRAGIILMVVQVLALFGNLMAGGSVFEGGILRLLGFFSFGIVGIILYVKGSGK